MVTHYFIPLLFPSHCHAMLAKPDDRGVDGRSVRGREIERRERRSHGGRERGRRLRWRVTRAGSEAADDVAENGLESE